MAEGIPIVLFDGVCNLCNHWVNFTMDHARPEKRILFGAMQSVEGEEVIRRLDLPQAPLDSIILIDSGKVYRESDAVLRIMNLMETPWNWLNVFRIVPRFIRDGVYSWIAKNRYRWFGVRDSCRLPTAETRGWFLEHAGDEVFEDVTAA